MHNAIGLGSRSDSSNQQRTLAPCALFIINVQAKPCGPCETLHICMKPEIKQLC